MTTPFRLVLRGLTLVTAGTVVLVLVWLCVVAAAFDVVIFSYSYRQLLLAVCGLGLVLAFAGRCYCLTLPPEARAARAWSVLSVILDGCGLSSAAAGDTLAEARISLPPMLVQMAVLFSLGGLALGRVAFHFNLWSVARYVDDRPLAVRALTVFWHAGGLVGVIALVTWGLSYRGMGRAIAQCWLVVVTAAAVQWTWRHLRLLTAVKAAVRDHHQPLVAYDDPDREYRERYEQLVRDGLVSPDDDDD